MIKRRVGIELTPQQIRLAIFNDAKESPTLLRLVEQPLDDSSTVEHQLQQLLEGRPGFGDRFCTTLAASDGFVRPLSFPFSDPRKVEAAARMELAAQLPIDISEHIVASTPPQTSSDSDATPQTTTLSATVPQERVAEVLTPFDAIKWPLQQLGLSPLCEAQGVSSWFRDGFVVLAHEQQLQIVLLQQGKVISVDACGTIDDDCAATISRETALIRRSARLAEQPLCLLGSHITAPCREALQQQGLTLVDPPWRYQDQPVAPAFLPVCARALAADQPQINFRQGPFALKSEWASLKKHLYLGGGLLLCSLLIFGATAWRSYQHKTTIANGYRTQMTQLFRQTLPGSRAIVDIPMQMKAELNQLQKTSQLVGLDKTSSALAVLRAVSAHTPKDLTVDIKNFNYEPQALVLDGVTNSFDSVNRLARELGTSPLFSDVRIADAKTGIDGQQVGFRLQLTIGQQGGSQ